MSKKDEALKLALEALELAQDNLRDHSDNCFLHDEGEYNRCFCGKASLSDHFQSVVEKLEEALAEQPAQQDSTCSNALRAQGKAYPRTCKKCGLGPCVELAQQALDKKAENARELGLDYEPAQRHWQSLTDEEMRELEKQFEAERVRTSDEEYLVIYPAAYWQWQRAIEAKLKEKNDG